jgi:hypothetical protein
MENPYFMHYFTQDELNHMTWKYLQNEENKVKEILEKYKKIQDEHWGANLISFDA